MVMSGIENLKASAKGLKLAPAEQEYADALTSIADKYGKLSDYDENGIWVGYVKTSQNDNLKRGVACVNCYFYESETKECHIVKVKIEPGGYCRLAAIYPGLVTK
jgi:hypothetical protein